MAFMVFEWVSLRLAPSWRASEQSSGFNSCTIPPIDSTSAVTSGISSSSPLRRQLTKHSLFPLTSPWIDKELGIGRLFSAASLQSHCSVLAMRRKLRGSGGRGSGPLTVRAWRSQTSSRRGPRGTSPKQPLADRSHSRRDTHHSSPDTTRRRSRSCHAIPIRSRHGSRPPSLSDVVRTKPASARGALAERNESAPRGGSNQCIIRHRAR